MQYPKIVIRLKTSQYQRYNPEKKPNNEQGRTMFTVEP